MSVCNARFAAVVPPRISAWKRLVMDYGMPLALYYFVLNECCVVIVTFLLHRDYMHTGDVVSLMKTLGAERYFGDLDNTMKSSVNFFGIFEVSGQLAANFAAASAFMSLWTPLQIPFCVATLPYIRKVAVKRPTV